MPRGLAAVLVPHHQAAVDMAKAELQYGKDPALKSLAQDMVGEREIAMMKAWKTSTRGRRCVPPVSRSC